MQIIELEENSRAQVVTISITCRGNAKLKIITILNPLQTLNNNYSSKILKAIRQKRQILSERPKKQKPKRRPKSAFRTGLSATAKPRIDRRARFLSDQSTSLAITVGSSFNFAPFYPSSMSMNKPFSTLRKPRVWPLSWLRWPWFWSKTSSNLQKALLGKQVPMGLIWTIQPSVISLAPRNLPLLAAENTRPQTSSTRTTHPLASKKRRFPPDSQTRARKGSIVRIARLYSRIWTSCRKTKSPSPTPCRTSTNSEPKSKVRHWTTVEWRWVTFQTPSRSKSSEKAWRESTLSAWKSQSTSTAAMIKWWALRPSPRATSWTPCLEATRTDKPFLIQTMLQ